MAAITATTTATALTLTNAPDARLYIQNRGSAEIFIGPDNTVTAANGIGLAAGATLEYPEAKWGASGYDLYVITASGTADVRWTMI